MANRPRGASPPPKLAVVDVNWEANGQTDPAKIPIRVPPGVELTGTQQKLWDQHIAGNRHLSLKSSMAAYEWVELAARYLAAPGAMSAAMRTRMDRLSKDLVISDADEAREERQGDGGSGAGPKKPTAGRFLSKRKTE